MKSTRIRVLIVEDSLTVQALLVHILTADPQIEIVGVAGTGERALELLAVKGVDVITMDLNLPGINGLEVTRRIMESQPLPIVVVSASWNHDEVVTTFNAIEAGAVAVMGKPRGTTHPDYWQDAARLVQTVKAMSEVKLVKRWSRSRQANSGWPGTRPPLELPERAARSADTQLVAIGASTGGPLVLQTILANLPRPFAAPVLIVQHIAAGFLPGLVEWLVQTTRFPVHIAADAELSVAGHAYIAPDGFHMGVRSSGQIALSSAAPDNGLRPSVAHLFASASRSFGAKAAGVLLTGMGRDGADELKLMRQQGSLTIAQNEETSVVFGMPGEAVKLDAAAHVLSPEQIAALLGRSVRAK